MKIFASNLKDRLNIGISIDKCRIRSKGVARGSRDHFGNFGTPSTSRQRLKLEIQNLESKSIRRGTIVKNEDLGQNGSPGGHVTISENLRTLSISRQQLKLETRNLAPRPITRRTIVKNENFGQNVSPGSHVAFWGILGPPYPVSPWLLGC